jgi:hypothetical protein
VEINAEKIITKKAIFNKTEVGAKKMMKATNPNQKMAEK